MATAKLRKQFEARTVEVNKGVTLELSWPEARLIRWMLGQISGGNHLSYGLFKTVADVPGLEESVKLGIEKTTHIHLDRATLGTLHAKGDEQ